MKSKYIIYSLFFILLLNCAGKGKSDDGAAAALLLLSDGKSAAGTSSSISSGAIGSITTIVSSGVYTTSVNATSSTEWVYVSLKNGGAKVTSFDTWDLKFQRMNVGTYSGTSVTGGGNGGACTTGSTDFTAAWAGTECTRSVDEQLISSGGGGAASFNASVNPVLASPLDSTTKPANSPWYNYSSEHVLTTRNFVYIVTGSDNTKYILKFLDYYSSAGTSGNPKFTWKKI